MNIQIFGTKKCFDTKKAERYFKERVMKTKHYLTLQDAELILDYAYQYALEHQFNVSIAIVDETGCLLAMKRMDGASPMTANLCLEKAKCSAISRKPSVS